MFHPTRTASGRALAAIAAAVLLAGSATASPASAAPSSRAEAVITQTHYLYYSSSSYNNLVGHATFGCGEPYTLQWGVETAYVRITESQCPF